MKAKITISRTSSRDDLEPIRISIIDESSGINVIDLSMSLSDFAECITGLGRASASIARIVSEEAFGRIGKDLQTYTAFCQKTKSHGKEAQRQVVLSDYHENYQCHGWIIKSDGTSSQQNGNQHAYIIARWNYPTNGSSQHQGSDA